MQHIGVMPRLAAKALAEQFGDIGFVVDDQDADAHDAASAAATQADRGRRTFLLFLPQFVFVPLMQGAMNHRTRSRVQIIRQLSVGVIEGQNHDPGRDRNADERIQRVFELNMGFFKLKFAMNFLMNLSTQLQIISALLFGGWAVYQDQLEIGGVVAFISGIGKITDPWGDLVNYFRDASLNQVRYALVRDALRQQAATGLRVDPRRRDSC